MANGDEQRSAIAATIAGLEAQRALLGDAAVDMAVAALRQQLAALQPAAAVPAPLEGEHKLVTVMFADLSGFTALSERLGAEQVRGLTNACFDHLVPVIRRYEGTVDKFVGDGVIALFGAPATHENDPERALRTALAMREALETFNAEHGTDLGVHFGINTGVVVAGGIGSRDRQEYSVMGPAVNIASRLEDASERGEILVGPDTYRLTAPLFDFEARSPLVVKGRTEPVAAYRLLRPRAAPVPMRGIAGLSAPLVGREEELQALQEALRRLQGGVGGQIALIAEAGLGKSRLIAEARQARGDGVTWLEGRALSYSQNVGYGVARDLLCRLVEIPADAAPPEMAAALRRGIEHWLPERVVEVFPYLARLLEAPLDDAMAERVQYLAAEALQQRMLLAFAEYVGARAAARPLALVWEDLHWADPSSLRVLEALLALSETTPLLLLLVFRPEDGRTWEAHQRWLSREAGRYQVLRLEPLTRDESAALLENLLQIENLPETTRQLLLEKAEGNAFFLEEFLRSLLDAGLVIVQGDHARLAEAVEEIEVPDTLQSVIAARIDRLAPDDKRTLQTASVIGRVFQERVLSYLRRGEVPEERLGPALAELRRRELIRRRGSGGPPAERSEGTGWADSLPQPGIDAEYIFKHVVTQEVTYGSLLLARRKELHRITAEALEALFPEHRDELCATLGYHFERAEMAEKALHYLAQAGDRARATYANEEAIALYRAAARQTERLIAAEPTLQTQWESTAIRLHEQTGDLLELTARHEEARAAYHEALAPVATEDRIRQSRIHRKIGDTWAAQRQYDEAFQAFGQAETTLEMHRTEASPEEWRAWIQIQCARAQSYYWIDKVDEMTALVEQIRPLVQQHGTPVLRAQFYASQWNVAARRERYAIAPDTVDEARRCVEALEEAGDPVETAYGCFRLGFALLWHGELEEAEPQIRSCLAVVERIGDVVVQSQCLCYLCVIFRKKGQAAELQSTLAPALKAATAAQRYDYIGAAWANQAWVAWRQGDASQARTHGETALQSWEKHPIRYMFQWLARWPLIAVALAEADPGEAVEHSRALLDSSQMRLPDTLASPLEQALQAWDGGDPATALTSLEQAMGLARELGYL